MLTDFQALLLEQQDGQTTASIHRLTTDQLPAGDVLVQVDYSSLNYKDAMAVTGTGKIVRQFPTSTRPAAPVAAGVWRRVRRGC